MSDVAGIYRCDGLVLSKKALAVGECEGCCFSVYIGREEESVFTTCLKNSTFYGSKLPPCEIVDASLIYIKLGDK